MRPCTCLNASIIFAHCIDYPVMHTECPVGREGERVEDSSWHATLGSLHYANFNKQNLATEYVILREVCESNIICASVRLRN